MSEILSENPTRRTVDIRECLIPIEKAAIQDSQVEGKLYNVSEYTREVKTVSEAAGLLYHA